MLITLAMTAQPGGALTTVLEKALVAYGLRVAFLGLVAVVSSGDGEYRRAGEL